MLLELLQMDVDVELGVAHLDNRVVPFPSAAGTVRVHLDAVALRAGEIERLAHEVVRRAVERQLGFDRFAQPRAKLLLGTRNAVW